MAVLVTVYQRASAVGKFQVRAQFFHIFRRINDYNITTNVYVPRVSLTAYPIFVLTEIVIYTYLWGCSNHNSYTWYNNDSAILLSETTNKLEETNNDRI